MRIISAVGMTEEPKDGRFQITEEELQEAVNDRVFNLQLATLQEIEKALGGGLSDTGRPFVFLQAFKKAEEGEDKEPIILDTDLKNAYAARKAKAHWTADFSKAKGVVQACLKDRSLRIIGVNYVDSTRTEKFYGLMSRKIYVVKDRDWPITRQKHQQIADRVQKMEDSSLKAFLGGLIFQYFGVQIGLLKINDELMESANALLEPFKMRVNIRHGFAVLEHIDQSGYVVVIDTAETRLKLVEQLAKIAEQDRAAPESSVPPSQEMESLKKQLAELSEANEKLNAQLQVEQQARVAAETGKAAAEEKRVAAETGRKEDRFVLSAVREGLIKSLIAYDKSPDADAVEFAKELNKCAPGELVERADTAMRKLRMKAVAGNAAVAQAKFQELKENYRDLKEQHRVLQEKFRVATQALGKEK